MQKVVSCEIIDTPRKWYTACGIDVDHMSCRSDHTAVLLELKDIPHIPPHRPCSLSSASRFKQQKTLMSMFGRQKRKSEDKTNPEKKQKKEDHKDSDQGKTSEQQPEAAKEKASEQHLEAAKEKALEHHLEADHKDKS